MIRTIATLTGVLATLTFAGGAQAADVPSAGQRVAQAKCAACHAIGAEGDSPNPKAPPLRNLYTRYPIDALRPAFLKGMEVGHRDMPTFILKPQEVTDLLAYIRSLDPCGRPSSDQAAMARCFAPMKP